MYSYSATYVKVNVYALFYISIVIPCYFLVCSVMLIVSEKVNENEHCTPL